MFSHQTHDALVGNPTWKSHGVAACGNQLLLAVSSLISHFFISSLTTALGVFPLLVCLSCEPPVGYAHSCGRSAIFSA